MASALDVSEEQVATDFGSAQYRRRAKTPAQANPLWMQMGITRRDAALAQAIRNAQRNHDTSGLPTGWRESLKRMLQAIADAYEPDDNDAV